VISAEDVDNLDTLKREPNRKRRKSLMQEGICSISPNKTSPHQKISDNLYMIKSLGNSISKKAQKTLSLIENMEKKRSNVFTETKTDVNGKQSANFSNNNHFRDKRCKLRLNQLNEDFLQDNDSQARNFRSGRSIKGGNSKSRTSKDAVKFNKKLGTLDTKPNTCLSPSTGYLDFLDMGEYKSTINGMGLDTGEYKSTINGNGKKKTRGGQSKWNASSSLSLSNIRDLDGFGCGNKRKVRGSQDLYHRKKVCTAESPKEDSHNNKAPRNSYKLYANTLGSGNLETPGSCEQKFENREEEGSPGEKEGCLLLNGDVEIDLIDFKKKDSVQYKPLAQDGNP
jgi:hypothetical protein